ncbi:LUD domain-containing protein [Candidatus Gottesmanbacteria bacterium]|nr:LUD domain-containing protein [Candidatus Gottesmanbacteria bacterium]
MAMKSWDTLADEATIAKTIEALKGNGIDATVVSAGAEAKERALSMLPEGAEVMTMSSVTLDTVGLTEAINSSSRYKPVRDKLYAMNRETQHVEMLKLGAAPEWTVGSVHAVTQDGHILIASYSGSQLPAYVYAAAHVIWVVGVQKIVANVEEGIKRISEYTLPLESERARKAYGLPGSAVNKLLIINCEVTPGRLTVVFVREKLGY